MIQRRGAAPVLRDIRCLKFIDPIIWSSGEVAALTVRCALSRRESRGLHHTRDCPERSRSAKDTVIREGVARMDYD